MTDAGVSRDPAVLVMATAPRAGLAGARLEPVLGASAWEQLQRTLIGRAARWAAALGPAWVAYDPADAGEEIGALVPDGTRAFAQAGGTVGERLSDAFSRVAEVHGGPVVVIGTAHPWLAARHARAVLDDLRSGIDVTFGPATGGGWYLLSAARPHPALFGIDPAEWGGPHVLELTIRAIVEAGLTMGWLTWERGLDEPADVEALLADPCAPADVLAVLRAAWHPARP